MANLTLSEAHTLMLRGRPWTFRLERYDPVVNARKFWMATGRAYNEPVEVLYGHVGENPTILIKEWDSMKVLFHRKGHYDYAATPFVRVRQATIDAHLMASNSPQPKAVQRAPAVWKAEGVRVRYVMLTHIEILFDVFPAPWQPASVYHSFKDTLEAFCERFLGVKVPISWEGMNSEVFVIRSIDKRLYAAIVAWLQQEIPGQMTPLVPPPKLDGPFAYIHSIERTDQGCWVAQDMFGSKVLSLTKGGARELMADYHHIKMAGLQ